MLVLGGFFIVISGAIVLAGPATATKTLAFWLVWEIVAWRLYRIALVVNDSGVRLRGPIKSRTIPWSEVRGFRSDATLSGDEQLVVEVNGGPDVWTSVRERGAGPGHRSTLGSIQLDPHDYTETLDRLEKHLPATP
jgi:PH (Pleckstrin Homology) domain-containing protein